MATIRFKGRITRTVGDLPAVGSTAPSFVLTNKDLEDVGLDRFGDQIKILNIVPSLDTGVCATSARKFNEAVSKLRNVVLLNISADLPFAASRFCETNQLRHIVTLSTFRSPQFGRDYGVTILDGPLAGLLSRAVLVLDGRNRVVYAQQVPEITQEPDYDAALAAVQAAQRR